MKRCSVKPYEGNEKYIFVSYCHKDRAYVFPIIEQLVKDGFRVWYDEGIDPGAEWPEIIASHLNGCASCIAFISENSLNSHNCRREINFALLKKKLFISVVLEPVQMSLGMEMQLSAFQSIFKYKLDTEFEFFKKLYEAKQLNECLGAPNSDIVVSRPSDYMSDDFDTSQSRDPFSSSWFIEGASDVVKTASIVDNTSVAVGSQNAVDTEELRRQAEEEARLAAEELRKKTEEADRLRRLEAERLVAEEERKKKEEAERLAADEERRKAEEAEKVAAEELRKKTEEADRLRRIEAERLAAEEERRKKEETEHLAADEARRRLESERLTSEDQNCRNSTTTKFMLKREKTGQVIHIRLGSHVIGRSETLADYHIEGNRMIGRTHATIIATINECIIVDNNSLNKTCINGIEIDPNVKYSLKDGDVLKIANELFAFFAN